MHLRSLSTETLGTRFSQIWLLYSCVTETFSVVMWDQQSVKTSTRLTPVWDIGRNILSPRADSRTTGLEKRWKGQLGEKQKVISSVEREKCNRRGYMMRGVERKWEQSREGKWSAEERSRGCTERLSQLTNAFCGIQQVCCFHRSGWPRERETHGNTDGQLCLSQKSYCEGTIMSIWQIKSVIENVHLHHISLLVIKLHI